MDLANRHPAIEAAGGGILTTFATGIHFANDWLTPALSFFTAVIGFVFAVHGVIRYFQRRSHKDRRKDD